MGEREKALRMRKIQFAILIATVLVGTGFLMASPAAEADVFGVSNKLLIAIAGVALLAIVAVAGVKILFTNLPEPGEEKQDVIAKVGDKASPAATGKMVEVKYADTQKGGKKVPFEEYLDWKK